MNEHELESNRVTSSEDRKYAINAIPGVLGTVCCLVMSMGLIWTGLLSGPIDMYRICWAFVFLLASVWISQRTKKILAPQEESVAPSSCPECEKECSEREGIALMWATLICMVLIIPALFASHVLRTSLLPQCPTCNKVVSTEYCPNCGWEANLASSTATNHCTNCNHPLGVADNFCPSCGTQIPQE